MHACDWDPDALQGAEHGVPLLPSVYYCTARAAALFNTAADNAGSSPTLHRPVEQFHGCRVSIPAMHTAAHTAC
jgi:hypothetical protein